ncbi:beta-lactamase family protein [Luteimonas sp. SJ-92]|uniref:Beta-lactamase family protein n=1 Tax=Luteimonas salinisoli TaxID=2752307 RepID=A0A853JGR3_9GAMM|nr:serine hydrolase domain-containing protein [Luteimonas salinisoli]NZA27779.1 beta-lactamase family protein [Luteimonas salinisoli]
MKLLAACLGVLWALASAAASAAPAGPGPESAAARIREDVLPAHYLEGHHTAKSIPQAMLEQGIPGVGIAFIDDGEIGWQLAFGYADLRRGTAVTPDTVFAAASLSKPVAAMAALHLAGRGLIGLDDDVNLHLRGWEIPVDRFTETEKVTLRRLIGHTAGVKNHLWSSYAPGAELPTVEAMLAGTAPSVDPPAVVESVPGQRYRYSNPGYAIVQKLIQDATGQDFATAIDRIVFAPAGMRRSSFVQPLPPALRAEAATGYAEDLQPYPDRSFPFLAAGGLWSTPGDLARFAATLMADHGPGRNRIVSDALAAEVFARSDARLGFTKKLGPGELLFEHWGSNAGFTSYLVGSLPHRQALVVMTNSDQGFDLMASIARAVAREYGWALLEPEVYRETAVPLDALERFAGTYGAEEDGGDRLSFTPAQGGLLLLREPGAEAAQALVPVGDETFLSIPRNTSYRFLEAKDGGIGWVRVTAASGDNNDFPRN